MSSAEPLVLADDVSLRYPSGTLALSGLDLEVEAGAVVGLVGPSGCGKSTLLRAIAGLETPTGGRLTVGGQSPARARASAARMAFVFQDANLLPWRTVEANVRLPLELLRVPPGERQGRIDQALEMVGLAASRRAYPAELSGGMQMRVSLARAFVTRPQLLLLDEPFGALDELTRQRLNEELLALATANRWTVIAVTHSVAEAVFLSRRVAVMQAPGRVVEEVPVDFAYPRDASLRESRDFHERTAAVQRSLRGGEAKAS